jgi:hypothetical protein
MVDLHLVETVLSAQFFDNIIKLPFVLQPEFLQSLFCVLPRMHGSQRRPINQGKTRNSATLKSGAEKNNTGLVRSAPWSGKRGFRDLELAALRQAGYPLLMAFWHPV